jgi:hypothetical protein
VRVGGELPRRRWRRRVRQCRTSRIQATPSRRRVATSSAAAARTLDSIIDGVIGRTNVWAPTQRSLHLAASAPPRVRIDHLQGWRTPQEQRTSILSTRDKYVTYIKRLRTICKGVLILLLPTYSGRRYKYYQELHLARNWLGQGWRGADLLFCYLSLLEYRRYNSRTTSTGIYATSDGYLSMNKACK